MMQIPILTRSGVHDLFTDVSQNIDRYRGDGFSADLLNESLKDISGTTIDLDAFATLRTASGSLSAGKADALNAHAVYNALEGMTPYLAQDERIWVAITHLFASKYVWARWVKKKDEQQESPQSQGEGASFDNTEQVIKAVKLHYFAKVGGKQRAIERNNAISSLWWWAHLVYRCEFDDHAAALDALLANTDFRESIVSRPSTSVNLMPFKVILDLKQEWNRENPESNFFTTRESGLGYREWFKRINRLGGAKFLAAYSEAQLHAELKRLLEGVAIKGE